MGSFWCFALLLQFVFNPSLTSGQVIRPEIATLNQSIPGLEVLVPSSPLYAAVRETYIIDNATTPLAIVRPQNADQVAEVVLYAVRHNLPISVRGGGHELFGRSVVTGALTIDMRDIKYVNVLPGNQLAQIGGGAITVDWAVALAKYGLVSPFSTVTSLGLGWNMIGGYSLFSGHYGMGVDQIVGAKVVTWDGQVVEADADMLFGIRGAVGNFGVVVELTIKVYPLKTILGGTIFFESSNLTNTATNYFRGYNQLEATVLPLDITAEPFVLNIPGLGKTFGVFLVSSAADLNSSQPFINQILALGTPIVNTIAELTIPEYVASLQGELTYGVYGSTRTVSVQSFSNNVTAITSKYLEQMPSDGSTLFYAHRLRGPSARPDPTSCFGMRESHWMVEIIGNVANLTDLDASTAWAAAYHAELAASDETLIQTYIALTYPGDNPTVNSYGANWDRLLSVKRKFDPRNVFYLAVPRLPEAYAQDQYCPEQGYNRQERHW